MILLGRPFDFRAFVLESIPMQPLLDILPQFDVVSFDVFDTLLLRPFTKPSDLFEKLERDFGAKGFAKARIRAERDAHRKARASGRIEATFDEIYALLPRWSEMKGRELAAEQSCWTANPEMADVWRAAKAAGKKIVVASDMYLPRSVLERTLRERGFDGWDDFYLSNDLQEQKASGAIYDRIVAKADVPPDRILHIGDNPVSDIARANEKGVVAYLSPRVFDRFLEECPFVRAFLGKAPSLDKRLFAGALAIGWHLYKHEHPGWTYWNRIGYLFAGPLGCSYVRFIGNDARRRNFNHLMFVARDGYILQKLSRILFPELRTDYFYATRELGLLAARHFGKTDEGIRIRRQFCLDKLQGTGEIRLDKADSETYLSSGVLPGAAQAVLDEMTADAAREAKHYFAQFDMRPGRTALVDGTSTHFTIQTLLQTVLGYDVFAYYLFTETPPELGKAFGTHADCRRFLRFTEFLFGAPDPPLKRITNGVAEFKDDPPFFERYKMGCSEAISDGAVAHAKSVAADGSPPDWMWIDWFDSFLDNQTAEDRKWMSLARDSVAIGHESGYRPVITPPHFKIRRLGCLVLHDIRRTGHVGRAIDVNVQVRLLKFGEKTWKRIVRIGHLPNRIRLALAKHAHSRTSSST